MIAPCNDMEPTLRIYDVFIERGRKTLHEKNKPWCYPQQRLGNILPRNLPGTLSRTCPGTFPEPMVRSPGTYIG